MPEIVLTEEQARVLAQSTTAVLIRGPSGVPVGLIDPREAAVIEEARRRLRGEQRGISGPAVQAHLTALQQEWDRTGGFDETHMLTFLAKLRAEGGHG
ncbi:MAG TPA: hypothetical protein VFG68_20665 [Fimbriiglobus sp.]|nr:hypothetical protein [Fimbriiglobus sp.]